MPESSRDSQRSRVYAAESQLWHLVDGRDEYPTVQLFGSEVVIPDDRKFGEVDSAQRYVDGVLALNWVRERWPAAQRAVTVRARGAAGRAHYERATATIALPPFEIGGAWSLRELVVLHELAHHLNDSELHDAGFASIMLTLTEELIGPEAEFLLRTIYLENSVRI